MGQKSTGLASGEGHLAIGSSQSTATSIKNYCMSCGATWAPGTKEEDSIKALAGKMGPAAQQLAKNEEENAKAMKIMGAIGLAVLVAILFFMMTA